MKILVTGGAGFIGSSVIKHLINDLGHDVINLDKLTYSGNLESLKNVETSPKYSFEEGDICDSILVRRIFKKYKPNKVMHLAAESHVDRSIDGPEDFIKTNIYGTFILLEESRIFYSELPEEEKANFIFHHISTDEVFGDLSPSDEPFTETTPYSPSSPYSASKASSDHLVRAWNRTFGLPIVVSNCSNNYGPYQFPEKLIPLVILNAVEGKPLPIYGSGNQIRDWLYVEDHAVALAKVVFEGVNGATYNIGGCNEITNLEVVKRICSILDEVMPKHPEGINQYEELIDFVQDRPGHDSRYAINSEKINRELGWEPNEDFQSGLRKTVEWYLQNIEWCNQINTGIAQGQRLGLDKKS